MALHPQFPTSPYALLVPKHQPCTLRALVDSFTDYRGKKHSLPMHVLYYDESSGDDGVPQYVSPLRFRIPAKFKRQLAASSFTQTRKIKRRSPCEKRRSGFHHPPPMRELSGSLEDSHINTRISSPRA
jgi:hypothetical protein